MSQLDKHRQSLLALLQHCNDEQMTSSDLAQLRDLADQLAAALKHAQDRRTGPTPEQRAADEQRSQTGQVLRDAGLLEDYQAWCAGRIDRTELVRLVRLIAAGKAGHAHASDDAQAWLLEHQGDRRSRPAVGVSVPTGDDEHDDARARVIAMTEQLRARSRDNIGAPWRR